MTVQELKGLVYAYKVDTQTAYMQATTKHRKNDKLRTLRKIKTAMNMLESVPNETEIVGHIQPNNIGDIFEAVECYYRVGEFNRSPKGKTDLTLNGQVYEMKSLEGKDEPAINIHEHVDKGVFLVGGEVYELSQAGWKTIRQEFTHRRPSERNTDKWRIRNNAETREFIRTYGKLVRDFK
jgi:hypothetical protein